MGAANSVPNGARTNRHPNKDPSDPFMMTNTPEDDDCRWMEEMLHQKMDVMARQVSPGHFTIMNVFEKILM